MLCGKIHVHDKIFYWGFIMEYWLGIMYIFRESAASNIHFIIHANCYMQNQICVFVDLLQTISDL